MGRRISSSMERANFANFRGTKEETYSKMDGKWTGLSALLAGNLRSNRTQDVTVSDSRVRRCDYSDLIGR